MARKKVQLFFVMLLISVTLVYGGSQRSSTPGRYIALVIGNNNYRNGLRTLETPQKDADAVGTLLKTQYGFDITILKDGTRTQILEAIEQQKTRLKKEDHFLLLFECLVVLVFDSFF